MTPSRSAMESRRMEAVRLFSEGLHQAEVARLLETSRTSVSRWHRLWKEQGEESLHAKHGQGRRCRLADWQVDAIIKIFIECEPKGRKWTHIALCTAVQNSLGIKYHPDHIGRLLKKWGLSTGRRRGQRT